MTGKLTELGAFEIVGLVDLVFWGPRGIKTYRIKFRVPLWPVIGIKDRLLCVFIGYPSFVLLALSRAVAAEDVAGAGGAAVPGVDKGTVVALALDVLKIHYDTFKFYSHYRAYIRNIKEPLLYFSACV